MDTRIFLFCLLFFAFAIVQAFRGYRLRYFFRIFPGVLAGVLISFTTGFLLFMDGTRGDVVRAAASLSGNNLLADAIGNGDILGLLRELVSHETTREILMELLPDSAKVYMVFAVLLCIASVIVCAALEKPGVFLEFFAYGYTIVASIFAAGDSALLGALLGIVVGVLLGMLGYKISRGWIIVAPNLVNFLVTLFVVLPFTLMPAGAKIGLGMLIPLAGLALVIAIPIGVRRQFKETAAPKDGAPQPAAAASGLSVTWAEKCRAVVDLVTAKLSSLSKSSPAPGNAPGGQKFCGKCGNPLAPGAKFCAKCGAPTQDGTDAAKPM